MANKDLKLTRQYGITIREYSVSLEKDIRSFLKKSGATKFEVTFKKIK